MSVLLKGFLILSYFFLTAISGNAQSKALTFQNSSHINIGAVPEIEIRCYLLKAPKIGITKQHFY
jgi:hypothetical protein